MCRKKCKSGSKPESANYVDTQNTQPQNSESLREYGKLFQISSGATKPFRTTLEVDTGASVSLISESTFKAIQSGLAELELEETATRLQTYTGEAIAVRGSTVVGVKSTSTKPWSYHSSSQQGTAQLCLGETG